jgi:hypothetical protein
VLTLIGRNVDRLRDALDSEIVSGGIDEQGVVCRTGTHLMVQMGHKQLEGEWFAEVPQSVQEDHRIGATGNRDE